MARVSIQVSPEAAERLEKLMQLTAKKLNLSKLSRLDYIDILTAEEAKRQNVK
jgi:hypothetical protein